MLQGDYHLELSPELQHTKASSQALESITKENNKVQVNLLGNR